MKQQVTGSQAFFLSIVPGLGHICKGSIASGLLWFIYMSLLYYIIYLLGLFHQEIREAHGIRGSEVNIFLILPVLLHFWCAANAVDLDRDLKEQ